MKAVVWTDTFQVMVLLTAMMAVLTKGTIDIGGFGVVFETNAKSQRTNFFESVHTQIQSDLTSWLFGNW